MKSFKSKKEAKLRDLLADHGHRLTGEIFNSIVHLTFPDSGRTQTLRGP